MTSYFSPELAHLMHREMLDRGVRGRTLAALRRRRRADRLTRKADELLRHAAELVVDTHR